MSRIAFDRGLIRGAGRRPLRCFEIDDTCTSFRKMVTVGDHDLEPTNDVTIVSSPSDMKRREIAKGYHRNG